MSKIASLSYLQDRDFLKELDNITNKFYWVKIEVLDINELPIRSIEGRIQSGSAISIDGNSSVRRTCNIIFVAEKEENDLTNIDNLLSVKRKIRIYEGLRNDINPKYGDIIWFKLGLFVIVQPSITHNSSGCMISLSCKDKMCLLNGECAGGLPTSVTFHEYDQIIGLRDTTPLDPTQLSVDDLNNYTVYKYQGTYQTWDKIKGFTQIDEAKANQLVGSRVSTPQLIYDIIRTLVCNYGGEAMGRIFINDVPLEIKQLVRYTGNNSLYYNASTSFYTTDDSYFTAADAWRTFKYNEDVGYMYTDFVYPGTLVSNIGENVCSVLDKVKNTLGNYEYFYDVDGNFVFQEIRNYLNTSYNPTTVQEEEKYDTTTVYRLDMKDKKDTKGNVVEVASNGTSIVDATNYKVDFHGNNKSVYTFGEGNGLVTSFVNTPNFTNIKNDFHIWGEDAEGYPLHYHLVIKEKPAPIVLKHTTAAMVDNAQKMIANGYIFEDEENPNVNYDQYNCYEVVFLTDSNGEYTGKLRLVDKEKGDVGENYVPIDWRAELYMQGLVKQKDQQRPDIYQQELLDLFDNIYNFKEKKFKADLVQYPNDLKYFFDYLDPIDVVHQCSVDVLEPKVYSYQQSKIKRMYNTDVPNIIMILDRTSGVYEPTRQKLIERCEREGQSFSNISRNIYDSVSLGTIGYTAQEVSRDLLYQYTNYNEGISIQCVPIYYLDVNSRITVYDKKSGIYGDYIIKSISLPLDANSTMSISATRALERI